jgi:hypothetical protein
MSEKYPNFLKKWSTERGITSFFGSDKRAFLEDWKRTKTAIIEPRPKIAEPVKEVKPTGAAALKVLTNPDLLKQIGSFTNPMPNRLKEGYDEYIRFRNIYLQNPKKGGKKKLEQFKVLVKTHLNDNIIEPLYRDAEKLFENKYGGLPLTNGDKSGLSEKEIDGKLAATVLALMKKYGITILKGMEKYNNILNLMSPTKLKEITEP